MTAVGVNDLEALKHGGREVGVDETTGRQRSISAVVETPTTV